ncbi:PREDICTED: E3 ubiquitin-protein ligase TRAIP [Nicrophorus vespilloides]|uniref:E3 ubiquitin-protein ligase TRAIP n=1 Tax=Nicrophorus vespilloides TaxID=110193 RepID=A0ABM1N4F4_NICVS|nr:PREDICTED: E3 ubiquitin-protein ligase TRAIP [Nicrophorus vespilloides]
MNIQCIICSDLFLPSSEIYSTKCGHMFHYVCLVQWMDRSKTCPQCRQKCTDKCIHRIYVNLQTTEGISEDIGTLQNRVDSLQFQVKLKDLDIKKYTEQASKYKSQNAGLRKELTDLENKVRTLESVIRALKEQVQFFKDKSRENDRVNDEMLRLKERLKAMENTQVALYGSTDQVNEMLRHNNNPESLTILVSTLKRELQETDRNRKITLSKLQMLQKTHHQIKKENEALKNNNKILASDIEVHKNCESERKYLKGKILELKNKIDLNRSVSHTPDRSVQRIIAESPAPQQINLNDAVDIIDLSNIESPTVNERVKQIMDSDSPYLPVKSNTVGLMNAKFSIANGPSTSQKPISVPANKFSIFKGGMPKTDTLKVSKPEYNYNGLGGHSKEDIFPSPIRASVPLKRIKSNSIISSSKFRKLSANKKV